MNSNNTDQIVYKLTDSTLFSLSYLNTIVKDFLPDHVTLISCGDNIQESVRSENKKRKKKSNHFVLYKE